MGKIRSNAVCVRDAHRFCCHRMSNPIPVWHRITHNLFQLNMNEFEIRIFTEIGHLMRSTHDFVCDIRFVSHHRSHQITSSRLSSVESHVFHLFSSDSFHIHFKNHILHWDQWWFSFAAAVIFVFPSHSDQQLCLFIFKQNRKWRSSCKSQSLPFSTRRWGSRSAATGFDFCFRCR